MAVDSSLNRASVYDTVTVSILLGHYQRKGAEKGCLFLDFAVVGYLEHPKNARSATVMIFIC